MYEYIVHGRTTRGSRGRGRSSRSGSRRASTVPWVAVNAEGDREPPHLPFSPAPAPDLQLPQSPKPVDYFFCLFTAQVLQHIVDETNR